MLLSRRRHVFLWRFVIAVFIIQLHQLITASHYHVTTRITRLGNAVNATTFVRCRLLHLTNTGTCTIAGAKGGSRKNENGAKRRSGGRKSPVGSRGKAPVEDLGDEVPQKPGVFFCILIVNLTVFRYNSLYIYIYIHASTPKSSKLMS